MAYRVVVTDTAFSKEMMSFQSELNKHDIECVVCDPEILKHEELSGYDAIAVQQLIFDKKVVDYLDPAKCRLVVKFGVGYENLDLSALTEAGIRAANVPDYGPDTVAQHAFYFILALAKHGIEYQHRIVSCRDLELGSDSPDAEVWTNKSRIPSVSLEKCVLGIIGYGRIGKRVAEITAPCFRKILACDPYIDPSTFGKNVERVDLETLLGSADFVTIHVPLFREKQRVYKGYPDYTPTELYYQPTHYMIDEKHVSMMKDGAFLINTSRGGVVKESAVIDALTNGTLAGCALDVFEDEPLPKHSPLRNLSQSKLPDNHPLLKEDMEHYNVLLTPHSSYYTEGILERIETLMAEEIIRVLVDGEVPKNLVNPSVLQNE